MILIILIIIPEVSAGYFLINPYSAEQGSSIDIILYPDASGMDCVGVIKKIGSIDISGAFRFNCNNYCTCYFPVSTSFNISKNMLGDYSASVWDNSRNDFVRKYFSVVLEKCSNGAKDGNETGIDCGGGKCNKCKDNIECRTKEDCLSGYCEFDNKCGIDNSIKNKNKYSYDEIFIVSDENWKDVLKLVPLAIWNENYDKVKYPVLIYHKEGNKFDFDSGIHFINQYNPSHLTIFEETPEKFDDLLVSDKKIGAGLDENNISKVSINDYYSYWNEINEVVISSNDYETGLMSSVFASYKNAPLLFSDNIDYGVLDKNRVYVIGNVDENTLKKIKSVSNESIEYSLEELQKEYLELTKSNKVMVVNANDLNIKIEKEFKTKKSTNINEIYSKNSLASPFLAAARDELIININISESPENKNCEKNEIISNNYNEAKNKIENEIKYLFDANPKFLTIIASPNSIPDSLYEDCHETGAQYREALDKNYAKLGGDFMDFGRIYGITVMDTSSYIARSVFYDKLSEQTYGSLASGMSIGHSFERYMENSQLQQKASLFGGYYSSCYTGSEREFCIKKIKVPSHDYSQKQYILFGDHGYSTEWADTLKSNKIPELDLSYVFAHACSTNNFWQGNDKLMSANMIRQGAIAYIGSIGVSYSDNSASESLKKLTSSNISLGELNKNLAEEFENYNQSYLMIGDPALEVGLKKISWTGIEFYNNSIMELEAISNDNIDANIISAISEKEIYSPENKILLKTSVKNNEDFNSSLYLEYNLYSLEEDYVSELELQKISIKANSEKEFNFSMDAVETMPSGNYKAIVRLLNKNNELDKKEIQFKVENTTKEGEILLQSCKDENCISETKMFNKNETVYLYVNNPDSMDLTASLTFPGGNTNQIVLPYQFLLVDEGVYGLLVTGIKPGYENIEEELIFGVKDIKINLIETCDSDNICEDNETRQNCPQDCIVVNVPEIPEQNNTDEGNNTEVNNSTSNNESKNNKIRYNNYYGGNENGIIPEESYNNQEDSSYEQNSINNIRNVEKINARVISNSEEEIKPHYIIVGLFISISILMFVILVVLIRKT